MKLNKNIFLTTLLTFSMLLSFGQKFVFYLHGAIIESQGPNAVDAINGFGAYKYFDILDSLKKRNFNVISEVRKPNTDVKEYAYSVSKQIDSLLKKKISPENITVIGASKGSVIAMYVSSYVKNKNVNYIFMGACTDALFTASPDIIFYGNILSIYEKSDFRGSCIKFKNKSSGINHYKETEINTGLKHGFLYRPIPEWLDPVTAWINNNYK